MPSPNHLLPVYGAGHELLQFATVATARRLIANGLVIPEGTKRRVRALLAVIGNTDLLRLAQPPTGTRFSHNHETDYNPKGVWTHKRIPLSR